MGLSFDSALLDLDGTVHLSGEILDQVDVELRRLDALGAKIYYMTNNTSVSTDTYAEKLRALDLPLRPNAVLSPTLVLARWLQQQNCTAVYAVGTEGFRAELSALSGVRQDTTDPSHVIIAFDRELTYDKLETACQIINRGVPYYLTHIDRACPSRDGPVPDCAAIGAVIEAATTVAPAGHFGKPGPLMTAFIRELVGPDERLLVAGDRVYTDAAMGLELGATTVLVCTGEHKPGREAVDPRITVSPTLAEYLRDC